MVISRARGSSGGLNIVLSTSIVLRKRILGGIDLAGDLDISVTLGKVGGLDESVGEDAGGRGRGRRGAAEGDGAVFAVGNVTSGLRGHHHAPVGG